MRDTDLTTECYKASRNATVATELAQQSLSSTTEFVMDQDAHFPLESALSLFMFTLPIFILKPVFKVLLKIN